MVLEKDYRKFLAGKRIVFVGACPNITGMMKGKWIDSFDVVVKTNGSIFLNSKDYLRDYGKRCDVLYTNVQFHREMRPLPGKQFSKRGVKWICMKSVSEEDKSDYEKFLKVRSIKNTIEIVHDKLYGALMGAFIFSEILDCEPLEFHLTGVDFFISKKKVFEDNNYREYLDYYLPEKIRIQGNRINKGKKEDGHSMKENTKYIYELWKKHDSFKMQDFILHNMLDIISGRRMQE